ncbi:MAG: SDR family NAD(P)-dependent oxidoreductase [Myxococcota bacterium]
MRWSAAGRAVSGQERVEQPVRWSPGAGDRVLVTGGTRGIGAQLAARLLDAGAEVVVVGRGGEVPDPRAVGVAADVTDRAALVAALAPHRPFTAVIHAAGVLADGPLGHVDPEVGAAARAVKVRGLLNAMAAAGAPKVVLATGSWAGRFGNRHQAHYAAANAQIAALAEHAPAGVRLVVAELPPWRSSEMVKSIPAAIQAAMRAEGVDFVGDVAGIDALWADLCGGEGAVVHGRALPWWNRTRVVDEVLSTDTHPYLLDHAIDGVPIFPLAAATDAVAAAASLPAPFEVRDLQLFNGIQVKEPVRMQVVLRGERAEIRTGERDTLAYRATVRPLSTEEVAGLQVPSPVTGGEAPKLTVEAFYRDVTFHTGMLQGLVAVDGAGADTARGRVRTSRPTDWVPKSDRSAWSVDPLALDSAFQLTALLAWERYQRAGTPVALARMVVLAPFPSGPVRVEARFGPPEGDRSRPRSCSAAPTTRPWPSPAARWPTCSRPRAPTPRPRCRSSGSGSIPPPGPRCATSTCGSRPHRRSASRTPTSTCTRAPRATPPSSPARRS